MNRAAAIVLPAVTPKQESKQKKDKEPRPMAERKYWDPRLHEMLRWKRPHNSMTEKKWASTHIVEPYNAIPLEDLKGEVLAHCVIVHEVNGAEPKTLFSSHVDTVHRVEGRQKITYNIAENCYGKNDGEPLGADCGAGVWLMLEMIDAKVPGLYLFHRGEECGGIGSGGVADHYPKLLDKFDRAVAFDRKATWSVITHQWAGRCCSDTFANALAEALNNLNDDFMYAPDDTGLFTDTANYTDYIGECTNVSVGYYSEHTEKERLDLAHLFALRDALVKLDWNALPCARKAGEVDPDDMAVQFDFKPGKQWDKWQDKRDAERDIRADDLDSYRLYSMTRREMDDLVYDDPELFVDLVRYELLRETPAWAKGKDDESGYDRY